MKRPCYATDSRTSLIRKAPLPSSFQPLAARPWASLRASPLTHAREAFGDRDEWMIPSFKAPDSA
jgi:hypothetical protein